jgi:hypothetical protein
METCKVTFYETMPCTSLGFECAGDEEMAEDPFEEEKDEAEMMMERTMRLKLSVYPLLPLRPLRSVDRLLHGQRRCDKRTRREKLKLRGR